MPKPARQATASIGSSVSSSRRRASCTRWESSHCSGVVPVSSRKRRAKVRGLTLAWRCHRGDVEGLARAARAAQLPGLLQRADHAAVRDDRGTFDELRLAALAVGRGDHVAGDPLPHRGAAVLADHVQAEVDAGAEPSRGHHRPFVDVERRRVDLDRREALGKRLARRPSGSSPGGRRAGRRVRARRRRCRPRARARRAPPRRARPRRLGGRRRENVEVGRHDDGVGGLQRPRPPCGVTENPVVVRSSLAQRRAGRELVERPRRPSSRRGQMPAPGRPGRRRPIHRGRARLRGAWQESIEDWQSCHWNRHSRAAMLPPCK